MTRQRSDSPKDSEISVEEWLQQVGATEICFSGGSRKEGPPDFIVEYAGEEIAIEVCLLHDRKGWEKTREIAFRKEVEKLIAEESKKTEGAPRWHPRIEYDPRQPESSISDRKWKKNARRALRTSGPGGEFQLLSTDKVRGRGVILELVPTSNEGCFLGVSVDEGCMVGETLAERIVEEIRKKTGRVRNGTRAKRYDRWWLVFDDEILIAPIKVLDVSERARIAAEIRKCSYRGQWSKIVLVSRFQTVPTPQKPQKWFYTLWEEPRHSRLPVCS